MSASTYAFFACGTAAMLDPWNLVSDLGIVQAYLSDHYTPPDALVASRAAWCNALDVTNTCTITKTCGAAVVQHQMLAVMPGLAGTTSLA